MTRHWTRFTTAVSQNWLIRTGALVLYYLAILLGLLLLYGNGDFSAPEFIYQGF